MHFDEVEVLEAMSVHVKELQVVKSSRALYHGVSHNSIVVFTHETLAVIMGQCVHHSPLLKGPLNFFVAIEMVSVHCRNGSKGVTTASQCLLQLQVAVSLRDRKI